MNGIWIMIISVQIRNPEDASDKSSRRTEELVWITSSLLIVAFLGRTNFGLL